MSKRRTPKRARDVNQLAHQIVGISTGEESDDNSAPANPAAARRGMARAAKLTPERKRAIAKEAAIARWSKKNDKKGNRN